MCFNRSAVKLCTFERAIWPPGKQAKLYSRSSRQGGLDRLRHRNSTSRLQFTVESAEQWEDGANTTLQKCWLPSVVCGVWWWCHNLQSCTRPTLGSCGGRLEGRAGVGSTHFVRTTRQNTARNGRLRFFFENTRKTEATNFVAPMGLAVALYAMIHH